MNGLEYLSDINENKSVKKIQVQVRMYLKNVKKRLVTKLKENIIDSILFDDILKTVQEYETLLDTANENDIDYYGIVYDIVMKMSII